MKIFTARQIAAIDRYTIDHEPIADIDLMERAALRMTNHLGAYIRFRHPLFFFAGPGNNGGDALAMARLYAEEGYPVTVFLFDAGRPLSPSCATNRQRLADLGKARLHTITTEADFPIIPRHVAVVEGLFGAGLTRSLEGVAAALVRHINASSARIFAIDMPAGLMAEDNHGTPPENIIHAWATFTLHFPKMSLLFPENERFSGRVEVVDIALHPRIIADTPTPFRLTGEEDLRGLFPRRRRFAHKGDYGHALLIAGSYGKTGAAILATQGCLRSGAGLVTTHTPRCGVPILQGTLPEAMCSIDPHEAFFTEMPPLEKFNAIGVGPGLGTALQTGDALRELLKNAHVPMVLDADALNLIALSPEGLSLIPRGSVITPHPGEFRRLIAGLTSGVTSPENTSGEEPSGGSDPITGWQRLELQRELSRRHDLVILLKGAFSTITLPNGDVFFNPTGNPGMATAGSGDVLTGIITALLAQGLSPAHAAIAGAYLHGLAGDMAAERITEPSMVSSDIHRNLGRAFRRFYGHPQQEIDYF